MTVKVDSVGFKLVCNVHVWAYFEKLPISGKTLIFTQENGLRSWAEQFMYQIYCSQ